MTRHRIKMIKQIPVDIVINKEHMVLTSTFNTIHKKFQGQKVKYSQIDILIELEDLLCLCKPFCVSMKFYYFIFQAIKLLFCFKDTFNKIKGGIALLVKSISTLISLVCLDLSQRKCVSWPH